MLEQGTLVTNCLEEKNIAELFESLVDVLKKEIVIDHELKAFICAEKKLLLSAPSLEQIGQNNVAKENMILKTRMLEEVRTNLIKKLASALGYETERVRLLDLAAAAPPRTKQKIEHLVGDLSEVAAQIAEINADSSGILESAIEQVESSIGFLSSLVRRSGVYSGDGRINTASNEGRLVRTEG